MTFRGTSRDDPHGIHIEGTPVAIDVYMGRFTETTHTFDTSGEFPLVCHVYCGGLHNQMRAVVLVE